MADNFDFDKEVLKEFQFLIENGFVVEEVLPTIVRYTSDLYRINVFYGPHTREIGIEFDGLAHSKFGACSLAPLIAVFDRPFADAMPMSVPATTGAAVQYCVGTLARDFRTHIRLDGLRSPDLLAKARTIALEMAATRYPTITTQQLQARFQAMWEKKQYTELIELFEALYEHLTDDERAKFDAAKRALT